MVVHPRLRVAIATALLQLSYKPTLRTLNGQSPLGQDAHRYRKSPQVSNGTSQNIETNKPRTISDRVSVTKVAPQMTREHQNLILDNTASLVTHSRGALRKVHVTQSICTETHSRSETCRPT